MSPHYSLWNYQDQNRCLFPNSLWPGQVSKLSISWNNSPSYDSSQDIATHLQKFTSKKLHWVTNPTYQQGLSAWQQIFQLHPEIHISYKKVNSRTRHILYEEHNYHNQNALQHLSVPDPVRSISVQMLYHPGFLTKMKDYCKAKHTN